MKAGIVKALLLVCLGGLVAACDSVRYYGQAATGHLSLMFQRQSIEQLLRKGDLPLETRHRLETVLAAAEFGEQQLGLPGGSYDSYVQLDREHVVWNVFAAPEFSLTPQSWCFPVAGCVSYRGYFSEGAARRYADQLRADGLDVYVAGVGAYSTLGWFNDPLLSSVINRPEHRLVALIFHELAHQLVYVPGDTTFNESFATFVEREGLRRWLLERGDITAFDRFLMEEDVHEQFVSLVTQYRNRMHALYQSELPETAMRAEKQHLQESLRQEHKLLMQQWGYPAYQGWFMGPLNNAQLATIASYNDLVPAFEYLLHKNGGVLADFYRHVGGIAQLPPVERRVAMQAAAEGAIMLAKQEQGTDNEAYALDEFRIGNIVREEHRFEGLMLEEIN